MVHLLDDGQESHAVNAGPLRPDGVEIRHLKHPATQIGLPLLEALCELRWRHCHLLAVRICTDYTGGGRGELVGKLVNIDIALDLIFELLVQIELNNLDALVAI